MKKIGIAFLLLLVIAIGADISQDSALKEGYIQREEVGEEEKELHFLLNIEGIQEDYPYSVEVPSVMPTKAEAEGYFKETLQQIETDFSEIGSKVPLRKEYLAGKVNAKWSFQPFGFISPEGEIDKEKLEQEETIIQAQAELTCGAYEQIYQFPFVIRKPELSKEESILLQIEEWLQKEVEKEGDDQIWLPTEVDGVSLEWSERKEYVTPQIFVLEVVAFILLWMVTKRKSVEDEKRRIAAMEQDYPDIVTQLALLLQAGMTTRQAWNRIASQYSFKRKANLVAPKPVYEAVVRMNRIFMEGESERVAYLQFLEVVTAPCYRKLMRILLGNLEKGTQGIAIRLQDESRQAFEKKILYAKKLGEEASTKMLAPLMLMLLVVMGMMMLPALMEFQI